MAEESPAALTIAELAERTGTTRRTIRYYVAEGLLPPPGGGGQRRVYSRKHLVTLQAIQRMKEAFLPLSEIRRRLAGLTEAQIERLASDQPDRDRLGKVAALLARATPDAPPRWRSGPMDFSGVTASVDAPRLGARDVPRAAVESIGTGSAMGKDPVPSVDAPETVWHRVTLAPGVELHYQLSGDRIRDEAIAHLIRSATSVLKTIGGF